MAGTDDDELLRAVKRVRRALLSQTEEAIGASKDEAFGKPGKWFDGYASGLGHAADMLKNAMEEATR